jgi:hypothetical protein
MNKALPYILLAVMIIAALAIKRCNNKHTSGKGKLADGIDRNYALHRRSSFIEYTDQARCRMQCEKITEHIVENSLLNWTIDTAASEFSAHPCPIYTLEGYTSDSQHLRIVFAQCDFKTKVITGIHIDSVYACGCAGVGQKYER